MSQRNIFIFWLPLFGSWLLMSLEGAIITMVVSRLPEPVMMLAAFGIVLGLSVFIQSPIMNLLATSTAKVKDYATYQVVQRFTIHWLIILTGISIAIAFTPLFDLLIIQAMGVPSEVAELVRVGMRINIFWTAAVGWRRFQQGVLIHFNRPRTVVIGTVIRLATGAATALGLMFLTDVSGIIVASWTLQIAIMAEAIYATLVTRPLLKDELAPTKAQPLQLAYRDLFFFHLPLAGSALLSIMVQPLAVFSLARLANATNSLAAWPILFQLLFIYRAPAMALPEVIIALNKNRDTALALRRFVGILSGLTLLATLLFVATPLQTLYLDVLQDLPPAVSHLVQQGLWLTLLFPMLSIIVLGLRGFLINQQVTGPVNSGMGINLAITAAILFLGISFNWPGITTATLALTIAVFIEMFYLLFQVRPLARVDLSLEPAPVA